jgi:hypothetical protein
MRFMARIVLEGTIASDKLACMQQVILLTPNLGNANIASSPPTTLLTGFLQGSAAPSGLRSGGFSYARESNSVRD